MRENRKNGDNRRNRGEQKKWGRTGGRWIVEDKGENRRKWDNRRKGGRECK